MSAKYLPRLGLVAPQAHAVLHLLGPGVEDLDGVGCPAPDLAPDHHHLPYLNNINHIKGSQILFISGFLTLE